MGRDVHAEAIVTKAKDTHVPLGDRAVEAVKSIVREYYDESMLSDVVYDENEGGLSTTPVGRGTDIKGKITVGKYFIEHIDAFARRVLQVGHELQHVQQQRDGMGGNRSQDKREFLAHSWGALEPAKSGTGHLPDAQRRDMMRARSVLRLSISRGTSCPSAFDFAARMNNSAVSSRDFNRAARGPPHSALKKE